MIENNERWGEESLFLLPKDPFPLLSSPFSLLLYDLLPLPVYGERSEAAERRKKDTAKKRNLNKESTFSEFDKKREGNLAISIALNRRIALALKPANRS